MICRQYRLFLEFQISIDSLIEQYLRDRNIEMTEFVQECQDSLNDTNCLFMQEDENKVSAKQAYFFLRREK